MSSTAVSPDVAESVTKSRNKSILSVLRHLVVEAWKDQYIQYGQYMPEIRMYRPFIDDVESDYNYTSVESYTSVNQATGGLSFNIRLGFKNLHTTEHGDYRHHFYAATILIEDKIAVVCLYRQTGALTRRGQGLEKVFDGNELLFCRSVPVTATRLFQEWKMERAEKEKI